MADLSGGDKRWFLRRIFRRFVTEPEPDGSTETENTNGYSGIAGIAWRDARDTTRTMATLMPDHENIPEQPRTVLEADTDGCVRWLVRIPTNLCHGLEEDTDLLLWMWADGSLQVATRPALNPHWSWSPPMFADRI